MTQLPVSVASDLAWRADHQRTFTAMQQTTVGPVDQGQTAKNIDNRLVWLPPVPADELWLLERIVVTVLPLKTLAPALVHSYDVVVRGLVLFTDTGLTDEVTAPTDPRDIIDGTTATSPIAVFAPAQPHRLEADNRLGVHVLRASVTAPAGAELALTLRAQVTTYRRRI